MAVAPNKVQSYKDIGNNNLYDQNRVEAFKLLALHAHDGGRTGTQKSSGLTQTSGFQVLLHPASIYLLGWLTHVIIITIRDHHYHKPDDVTTSFNTS